MMQQGFSGSAVQRKGGLVEKITTDEVFANSKERQKDLIALSHQVDILPRIDRVENFSIFMEFIDGQEGLTQQNAQRAGKALRLLHDQRSYPHPCVTGLQWLMDLANENLAQSGSDRRISLDVIAEYPVDALIHSESGQLIEKKDGSIVFIDIEGIGMGSRYHDLGQIYYGAMMEDQPEIYTTFIEGYQSEPITIEHARVKRLAGIVSLAYAGFGLTFVGIDEFKKRMKLGIHLLDETNE